MIPIRAIKVISGFALIWNSYAFLAGKHVVRTILPKLTLSTSQSSPRQIPTSPSRLWMTIEIENEDVDEVKDSSFVKIGEFFKSNILDRDTVRSSLVVQCVMVLTALAFGAANHVNTINLSTLSYDSGSMWLATQFAIGALGNVHICFIFTLPFIEEFLF